MTVEETEATLPSERVAFTFSVCEPFARVVVSSWLPSPLYWYGANFSVHFTVPSIRKSTFLVFDGSVGVAVQTDGAGEKHPAFQRVAADAGRDLVLVAARGCGHRSHDDAGERQGDDQQGSRVQVRLHDIPPRDSVCIGASVIGRAFGPPNLFHSYGGGGVPSFGGVQLGEGPTMVRSPELESGVSSSARADRIARTVTRRAFLGRAPLELRRAQTPPRRPVPGCVRTRRPH